MLKEYEEDGQQLPGDGSYGSNDNEDKLTSEEIDIIHDVEQLVAQSRPHNDSDSNSKDNSDTNKDDKGDGDFIPKLKLKGMNVIKSLYGSGVDTSNVK